MNYWLLCLPRKDMDHCIEIGTFGLSKKRLISSVRAGDSIVCTAGKGDWKIIGIGSATSDYYFDTERIFLKDSDYPDRFDFAIERFSKEREVDIMTIIDQLSFVKNLAYWALYFRNGIAKMSEKDWKIIQMNTQE